MTNEFYPPHVSIETSVDDSVVPAESEHFLKRIQENFGSYMMRLMGMEDRSDQPPTPGDIMKGLDQGRRYGQEQAIILIGAGHSYQVANHFQLFTGLSTEIILDLMDRNFIREVLGGLEYFSADTHADIARKLLENGDDWRLANKLSLFNDLPGDIALDLLDFYTEEVISNIDHFSCIDADEFVARIYMAGRRYQLMGSSLALLAGVNPLEVAKKLMEAGYYRETSEYLEDLESLDDLGPIIVDLMMKSPSTLEYLETEKLKNIRVSKGQSEAIYAMFLSMHTGPEDAFSAFKTGIELMKNLPRNEDNPLPPWYFEIFDRSGGTTPIICIDDLINERESAEAADLGVHSTGAEGLADLYEVCRELRTKYQSVSLDESDEQLLATSALARSVFAAVVGFDDTEYGSSGDDEIRTLCEEYVKHKQAGDIRELEHGYEPSRIYDVPKKGDSSGPLITEDVLDRYEILRDDMEAAEIAMDEQFGLGLLVDRVKQAAAKTATVMEDDIAALDTDDSKFEIKYRNMKQRHQVLNDYLSSLEYGDKTSSRFVMNSSIEVQRGIEALAGFGDVHPAMRQLIIAWAMHQSPDLASHISNLSFDDPSVDDVESMWLIVDQIQTQIYGSHFDNPRIKQQFLRIMSVVSLEKEIARHEKLKEKGKTTGLQFVPSKGIFFEASGQIAGACWAGQFDSINLQMPNMSSIIMRARPGAKTERIVGAALLIETTDIDTGEGVLVLRGLNPSENYISKVNIKAFYDATVDYVKQIANNRGLIPAIAIDDHSGGAGTNREKLFDYIEDLDFDDFEERIYVDDNDSTFNGYDISNMTYAL